MFEVNQNFIKFIKSVQNYRINSLYLDVYHNLDVVALARLLNDNCNDAEMYRENRPENCRDLKSKGRCEEPDEFMKSNCKRTCGLCPKIKGFSGDSCTQNSDCINQQCKKSKKICLTKNPKHYGQECGVDYQCASGYCNPVLLKCEKKFIHESCDVNEDCKSGKCQNMKCQGNEEYTWIGNSPLCAGYPDACSLKSLSYQHSTFSKSLCGDEGGWCYLGTKILCSNFMQNNSGVHFWLPLNSNDRKCDVIESDCLRYNSTFVLKTRCGNSNVVCEDEKKFKILCGLEKYSVKKGGFCLKDDFCESRRCVSNKCE